MTTSIYDLDIPAPRKRSFADGGIEDTDRLRILTPTNLVAIYKLTPDAFSQLQAALEAAGEPRLEEPTWPEPKPVERTSLKGRCKKLVLPDGSAPPEDREHDDALPCMRKNAPGKRSCEWHLLVGRPIAEQLEAADQRRATMVERGLYNVRARVPKEEWPPGERWCADCQAFVPLFYCRGSRCYAHASRAAHASMLKRVYDFTREDYDALLAWQKGRCYVCQQLPRSKRLAVDHDHRTGEVRGLLCASDEWGCNHTLQRVLNSKDMARRLLEYVTKNPLQRMMDGEPPVTIGHAPRPRPTDEDDPFDAFLAG